MSIETSLPHPDPGNQAAGGNGPADGDGEPPGRRASPPPQDHGRAGLTDKPDPRLWEDPAARQALAEHDFAWIFQRLEQAGYLQLAIAQLTGMHPSQASAIARSRHQVLHYDLIARILDGLGAPRCYAGMASCGGCTHPPGRDHPDNPAPPALHRPVHDEEHAVATDATPQPPDLTSPGQTASPAASRAAATQPADAEQVSSPHHHDGGNPTSAPGQGPANPPKHHHDGSGPAPTDPAGPAGPAEEAVLPQRASSALGGQIIRAHQAEAPAPQTPADPGGAPTHQVAEQQAARELTAWQSRPLDAVYPVMMIGAVGVKISDGGAPNRPVWVVLGVTCHGHREVLGLWPGTGTEGAEYWRSVFAELSGRGITDVCLIAADKVAAVAEAAGGTWPAAQVQPAVLHLIRASLRCVSAKYLVGISKDLRALYTAPTTAEARTRLAALEQKWAERYPAIGRLWRHAWPDFTAFLALPAEIRTIVFTTTAIEALSARYRQATRGGHLPTNHAALTLLHQFIRAPRGDLKITGKIANWKTALNALALHYGDRIPLA